MNEILLTVSGEIDPQVEEKTTRGERPQADYIAMAHGFPADLMDYGAARKLGGRVGRLLEKVSGPNLMLAWACFSQRRRYRVVFTDGEQVGIPLAFLLKFFGWGPRAHHLMIGHILSVGKKMLFFDLFRVQSHIDRIFVYATCQQEFITQRWGLRTDRVIWTPFMVDANFFDPTRATGELPPGVPQQAYPLICTVGLEFRDYPTLLEAVDGLEVQVVIAAASPWSKRSDSTAGQEIPANVLVRRFSQYELRDLYTQSAFIVLSLYPVEFQAGVTTLLEAMSLGKAVICTRTPGQTDVVVDGETGLYVPPSDAPALRRAIEELLDQPEKARQMGCRGRERVLQEMSLEKYVDRLAAYIA